MTLRVGIIGAMDQELKAYCDGLKYAVRNDDFVTGELLGRKVVIAKSGVGKVRAAIKTQAMISRFELNSLILTGVGAGISERLPLNVGDAVVGEEFLQHDMDATGYGLRKGETPFAPDDTVIWSDRALVNAVLGANLREGEGNVFKGRYVTGDVFIHPAYLEKNLHLIKERGGDVADMEAYAVALTCKEAGVPHVTVKTISDNASARDFRTFAQMAADNSYGVVSHLLRNFPER